MRTIIATAVLLISGLIGSAVADPYRWCAEGVNGCGTSSCNYVTLEQCRAAAAGNSSAYCSPNPYYTGPNEAAPRRAKKKRS